MASCDKSPDLRGSGSCQCSFSQKNVRQKNERRYSRRSSYSCTPFSCHSISRRFDDDSDKNVQGTGITFNTQNNNDLKILAANRSVKIAATLARTDATPSSNTISDPCNMAIVVRLQPRRNMVSISVSRRRIERLTTSPSSRQVTIPAAIEHTHASCSIRNTMLSSTSITSGGFRH